MTSEREEAHETCQPQNFFSVREDIQETRKHLMPARLLLLINKHLILRKLTSNEFIERKRINSKKQYLEVLPMQMHL